LAAFLLDITDTNVTDAARDAQRARLLRYCQSKLSKAPWTARRRGPE
jgi:hypothetical protein